jgi:hypothetical protein
MTSLADICDWKKTLNIFSFGMQVAFLKEFKSKRLLKDSRDEDAIRFR